MSSKARSVEANNAPDEYEGGKKNKRGSWTALDPTGRSSRTQLLLVVETHVSNKLVGLPPLLAKRLTALMFSCFMIP